MSETPRLELHLREPAVHLTAAAGEVLVLEGAAGRVAAALDGSDRSARVLVDGTRLRGGLSGRVRAGVVVVRDVPVAADVSVLDHLAAGGTTRRARALIEDAPLLGGRSNDPAGVLSGGERVVLAWLRAMLRPARVVLLDRATAGLDRDVVGWATEQVEAWRSNGALVLVVPSSPVDAGWGRVVPVEA